MVQRHARLVQKGAGNQHIINIQLGAQQMRELIEAGLGAALLHDQDLRRLIANRYGRVLTPANNLGIGRTVKHPRNQSAQSPVLGAPPGNRGPDHGQGRCGNAKDQQNAYDFAHATQDRRISAFGLECKLNLDRHMIRWLFPAAHMGMDGAGP